MVVHLAPRGSLSRVIRHGLRLRAAGAESLAFRAAQPSMFDFATVVGHGNDSQLTQMIID
jgi:hypothetical protein